MNSQLLFVIAEKDYHSISIIIDLYHFFVRYFFKDIFKICEGVFGAKANIYTLDQPIQFHHFMNYLLSNHFMSAKRVIYENRQSTNY